MSFFASSIRTTLSSTLGIVPKSSGRFALAAASVVASALAISAGSAQATVLTFDMGMIADGSDMGISPLSTYGSRVGNPFFDALNPQFAYGSGGGITDNVLVEYRPGIRYGLSASPAPRRFGDFDRAVWRDRGGDDKIEIIFTGLGGGGGLAVWNVLLHSFDVAALVGEDLPIRSVKVFDGPGNVLFSDPANVGGSLPIAPGVVVPGQPTRKTYDFVALRGAPLSAPIIRLVVDVGQIASKTDRIALDNIKFGQQGIPVPGSAALLGLAGLMATRRRR